MNCKNILIIGAHFDDAELGCGGTMARFSAEGKKVYKLTLTDNKTNFDERNIHVGFEKSLNDSQKACEYLGVEEILDFDFYPCCSLNYNTKIMQEVEKLIFKLNIDTVFIHYNCDVNQDHVFASQISETASRHCRNVLYYQSNGYILNKPFYPTYFIDITDYYEKKKNALFMYQGDHNRYNRLFDISLLKTELWGYGNEVKYAEGFVPLKICE